MITILPFYSIFIRKVERKRKEIGVAYSNLLTTRNSIFLSIYRRDCFLLALWNKAYSHFVGCLLTSLHKITTKKDMTI